ncbi:MAG TPA: lipid A-modifier LpxR family protein, partial [Acetobacteraceae bacterium]|nr:lipid A-modifier LpxR family protein [Acetobacteraceae bacterium]
MPSPPLRAAALPLALLLALSAPRAGAQELTAPPAPDPRGTLSLSVENDVLGNTDRYYTNGLQLAWRSPSSDLPAPLAWLDRQLDFLQGPGATRWGLAIGHSIFTPQNTQVAIPDLRDRPYAALLYGAASISRHTGSSFSIVELQAGL